jgi:hypothetical protein
MTFSPPLTDREKQLAALCASQHARKLRGVIFGLAIALAISMSGTTLGWYLTRHESVARTEAINDSRTRVLLESCRETNSRNRATLSKLDSLKPKHPTAKQLESIQSTKLLIAALVPFQPDCKAYTKRRLGA